jgi:hypothetical protein
MKRDELLDLDACRNGEHREAERGEALHPGEDNRASVAAPRYLSFSQ